MRVFLAQLNPLIGDLTGNAERILAACKIAIKQHANIVLTPELSLWGYPPRDLLLNNTLLDKQNELLDYISYFLNTEEHGLKVFIGIAEQIQDQQSPRLFNSIALVDSNGWKIVARKQLLPSYDVFDETRYFRAAELTSTVSIKIDGKKWLFGITICEDLWVEEKLQKQRLLGPDPIEDLLPKKIDILLNLSASPFSSSKERLRHQLAAKAAHRLACPVIYLNQVGGNDELIFDGASFIINANAEIALKMAICEEDFALWDPISTINNTIEPYLDPQQSLFQALVLGVRDYASKCGFKTGLIGLSGGIDSALVAVIAAAALGGTKITAVLMPSPWSSTGSIEDSFALAKRIGLNTHLIPIEELMKCFDSTLTPPLGKSPEDVTAENLQSRIRGTILMALANQQSHLLLSTGNKSELAVGYCTLYGDMNGGLSVIGDLYKTCVYELANWLDSQDAYQCRNRLNLPNRGDLIGEAILKKAPSAELRPNQLDSDSLPDYANLDSILKALIEERLNPQKLIEIGHEPKLITRIEKLLKKAEFKRRQAPPVLKVSHQSFGSGWRIPIATK